MHRFTLLVLAFILSLAGIAQAGVVVDQEQLDNSAYMAWFPQTDLAQSFQQANSNIAGAAIQLEAGVGTSDDITISLWNALPNAGGTMMATGTDDGVAAGQWAEVYWSPVSVVPDTTYYLVFTSANNTMGIAGSVTNPYPRGEVYANAGYEPFPGYDYTFETYANVGGGVPEPASLSLVAGGLAAVLLLRRRLA
jgi:hypothetical protein